MNFLFHLHNQGAVLGLGGAGPGGDELCIQSQAKSCTRIWQPWELVTHWPAYVRKRASL